jgi:hypothetical protein
MKKGFRHLTLTFFLGLVLLAPIAILPVKKTSDTYAITPPITPPNTPTPTLPITPPTTSTPTPTISTSPFKFSSSASSINQDESFWLFWSWDAWKTLGFCNKSVEIVADIPAGIRLDWPTECQSGNGCQYKTTLYNTSNNNCFPGSSVSTKAIGTIAGTYTITTFFRENTGLTEKQSINITVIGKPTPTPTPVPVNHAPVISNYYLPNVKRGSNYWGRINAYDINLKDNLTMKITNLPSGLRQGSCTIFNRPAGYDLPETKWIGCDIVGRTYTRAKNYKIKVTVSDGKKTVTKTLTLSVTN